MVQMACPAFAPGMRTPDFMRAIQIRPLRWLISRLPPSRKANDDIMRKIGHGASLDRGRIPSSFFDWYADLHRYTHTMRNDFDMIAAALNPKSFDPTAGLPPSLLGAVEAETLFLWGEDDGFGGREVADNTVAPMPNATLKMLPEFGHLPWMDDPCSVAASTAAFLSDTMST
jgi:pimeloyl-ACP methyl ester carboxylesterase